MYLITSSATGQRQTLKLSFLSLCALGLFSGNTTQLSQRRDLIFKLFALNIKKTVVLKCQDTFFCFGENPLLGIIDASKYISTEC